MATDVLEVQGNGTRTTAATTVALEPARRRLRLPEMAIGLVVVIGFSLAAVLWQLNATQKDPVLAMARDVARGEVLEAADIRVVYVSSDDPIAHLASSRSAEIVGRVMLSGLDAGALLTQGSVSSGPALDPGEGIVGLALDPGQVPSSQLRAGDFVNVIAAAPASAPEGDADAAEPLLVERAEVHAIEELAASGKLFVSLKASEADANRIAAAAERGPVRLVMVG